MRYISHYQLEHFRDKLKEAKMNERIHKLFEKEKRFLILIYFSYLFTLITYLL